MPQDITALHNWVVQEITADADGEPLNDEAVWTVVHYYQQLDVTPEDIVNSRHAGNPNILWDLYHFALVMIVKECRHKKFSDGACGEMTCKNYASKVRGRQE
jgi:hypothetical protein